MSDESRMRVVQNGKNGIVTIDTILDALGTNRVSREHGGVLKSTQNVVLPIEEVSRLVNRDVDAKFKTLTTTVAWRQQFVRHNVDAAGISMSREEFIPGTNSMVRNVGTVRDGLLKLLGIIDVGKNSTVANDNFFASNVGLVKEIARLWTS